MKKFILLFALFSCNKETQIKLAPVTNQPKSIVFIWFENHGFSQIVGDTVNAPYMNSLIDSGTLFTAAHGVTHPSYPNYIAWFSGSQQSITSDNCIDGTPKTGNTLYNQLNAVGKSFKWYSEGLPAIGSTVCTSGRYVEKHNPTTIFKYVPTDRNRPLSILNLTDSSTFRNWASVVCITPNLDNDMHDGSIKQGDTWLKNNFDKYIQWAKHNNSILVVYWDEDNKKEGNAIPVIMIGEHVLSNNRVTATYDHYSFTKLACSLFGASTTWAANVNNAQVPTGWEK